MGKKDKLTKEQLAEQATENLREAEGKPVEPVSGDPVYAPDADFVAHTDGEIEKN
jgi:hypothetical protein